MKASHIGAVAGELPNHAVPYDETLGKINASLRRHGAHDPPFNGKRYSQRIRRLWIGDLGFEVLDKGYRIYEVESTQWKTFKNLGEVRGYARERKKLPGATW